MSNIPGVQNDLSIAIFNHANEAVEAGFEYHLPEHKAARIVKAVVVRQGTVSGNPTVDFVFEDVETGQRFVTTLTGRLVKTLAGVL